MLLQGMEASLHNCIESRDLATGEMQCYYFGIYINERKYIHEGK